MIQLLKVNGNDGTIYSINTSHIVFYESITKPYYDPSNSTWKDSNEGSTIYINNFNPIKVTQTKDELDKQINTLIE